MLPVSVEIFHQDLGEFPILVRSDSVDRPCSYQQTASSSCRRALIQQQIWNSAHYYYYCIPLAIVEQVTDVQLTVEVCDDDKLVIYVEFSGSTSPDIIGYIVNCSNNGCSPGRFGENKGYITAPVGVKQYIVNIYTVNRCDQISLPTTTIGSISCKGIQKYIDHIIL